MLLFVEINCRLLLLHCVLEYHGSMSQHITICRKYVREHNAECRSTSLLLCAAAYCPVSQPYCCVSAYCHLQEVCAGVQCCVLKHRPQADAWELPGRSTNHLIAQDTNLLAEIMNKFV